jgi:hypothetical protein
MLAHEHDEWAMDNTAGAALVTAQEPTANALRAFKPWGSICI